MSADRYTIIRPIASGGMGTVYLGRREGDGGFSRKVALKRSHADLASDPVHAKRVEREATLASRIHHANVVSVVDAFIKDGERWLVLDWVDGVSLRVLLKNGALDASTAARIVLDACVGLAAAHELEDDDGRPAGLRHGDISPENILVGKDGIGRIADFGLARAFDSTLTATADRLVEGKLGYLAPELFAGSPFAEPSDLYSMAVVAWESFAGRRLFASADFASFSRDQRRAPPLSRTRPELAALDDVLAKALSYDPAHRFPTVRAFATALESALTTSVPVATPLRVSAAVRRVSQPEPSVPGAGSIDSSTRTPDTGRLELDSAARTPDTGVLEPRAILAPTRTDLEAVPERSATSASDVADPFDVPTKNRVFDAGIDTTGPPMASLAPTRRSPVMAILLGSLVLGGAAGLAIFFGVSSASSSTTRSSSPPAVDTHVTTSTSATELSPTTEMSVSPTSTSAPTADPTTTAGSKTTAEAEAPVATTEPDATARTKPAGARVDPGRRPDPAASAVPKVPKNPYRTNGSAN